VTRTAASKRIKGEAARAPTHDADIETLRNATRTKHHAD